MGIISRLLQIVYRELTLLLSFPPLIEGGAKRAQRPADRRSMPKNPSITSSIIHVLFYIFNIKFNFYL